MTAIKSITVFNDRSARVDFRDGSGTCTGSRAVEFIAGYVHEGDDTQSKSNARLAGDVLREIASGGNPADRIAAAQLLLAYGGGE